MYNAQCGCCGMTYFLFPIKISREVLVLWLAGCTSRRKGQAMPFHLVQEEKRREKIVSARLSDLFLCCKMQETQKEKQRRPYLRERESSHLRHCTTGSWHNAKAGRPYQFLPNNHVGCRQLPWQTHLKRSTQPAFFPSTTHAAVTPPHSGGARSSA